MFPVEFAPTTVKMMFPVITIYNGGFGPDQVDPLQEVNCDYFYDNIDFADDFYPNYHRIRAHDEYHLAFAQCLAMTIMGRWSVPLAKMRLDHANPHAVDAYVLSWEENLRGLTHAHRPPIKEWVLDNAASYKFRLGRRDDEFLRERLHKYGGYGLTDTECGYFESVFGRRGYPYGVDSDPHSDYAYYPCGSQNTPE
jgi:hypothetical protein